MNKKIGIAEVIIYIAPPHTQSFNAIDIFVTAAKQVSFGSINLTFRPPVVVDIGSIFINVVNEKYIHFNQLNIYYDVEKNLSLTAIDLQLLPPRMTSVNYIEIQHRMLRSMEISDIGITILMLSTWTRYINTNIRAVKVPRRAVGALKIAWGFPYKVINTGIPLTTFWATKLVTEVSGSVETIRKMSNFNIITLFDSTVDYFGNDLGTRYPLNIRTGIAKTHSMKTDVYLDYDSWFSRKECLPTNISLAGTNIHQEATHIFVLAGTTKKYSTSVMGQHGLYLDNIKATTESLGYADLGASKIWLKQQTLVGYSEFTKMVNYGFFVKIPNNIATYNVAKSWIGIPLLGTHLLNLDVEINLLTLNEINLSQYKTPNEILNIYGVAFGVVGTIIHHQAVGYIEITELSKRHQELYTGGDMVLQVTASNRLIHEDLLLHRPFLYRVFNIDRLGNFIYKIFNKEDTL